MNMIHRIKIHRIKIVTREINLAVMLWGVRLQKKTKRKRSRRTKKSRRHRKK
jgi:hypothetical protein